MSLVIRIEYHPSGDRRRAEQLHEIHVGNLSDLADVSDYGVWLGHPWRGQKPDTIVRGHRRSAGALALGSRVLSALRDREVALRLTELERRASQQGGR